MTCHGPDGPADSRFRLGGTVFLLRGADEPAPGALVDIQDSTGQVVTVTANAAGNFWVPEDAWDPVYPIQSRVRYGAVAKPMTIGINREPSCATCHLPDKPSRNSPGRVYVVVSRDQLNPVTP